MVPHYNPPLRPQAKPGLAEGVVGMSLRGGTAFTADGRVGTLDSRGVMSEEDNVKFVRSLWAAIAEGGLEASLELTDPGVEWRPHPAGGRVLTSQELLQFFREFQGERQLLEARPYSFHAHGDLVLASGSFRLRGRDRMAEFQIHFVYEFEDGALRRAATYATRGEAFAAMGIVNGE